MFHIWHRLHGGEVKRDGKKEGWEGLRVKQKVESAMRSIYQWVMIEIVEILERERERERERELTVACEWRLLGVG